MQEQKLNEQQQLRNINLYEDLADYINIDIWRVGK